MQKTIEDVQVRVEIDRNTVLLKGSGVLPENYPNHRNKRPYEVKRSELIEYALKHGREFVLPEGSIVIEDLNEAL